MMVDFQLLIKIKMMNNIDLLNLFSKLPELIKVLKYLIHLVLILLGIYLKEWVKQKYIILNS